MVINMAMAMAMAMAMVIIPILTIHMQKKISRKAKLIKNQDLITFKGDDDELLLYSLN